MMGDETMQRLRKQVEPHIYKLVADKARASGGHNLLSNEEREITDRTDAILQALAAEIERAEINAMRIVAALAYQSPDKKVVIKRQTLVTLPQEFSLHQIDDPGSDAIEYRLESKTGGDNAKG